AETVPLGLLLLLLVELNQTQPIFIHLFGITLIVGRLLHAWGLTRHAGTSPGRLIGMLLTLLSMFGMALLLLWQFTLAATFVPH
ncbi:MAG: MAPEG family protein, partial [Dokdonella sp.]